MASLKINLHPAFHYSKIPSFQPPLLPAASRLLLAVLPYAKRVVY